MVNTFDRGTKLSFRNSEHAHFIEFGGLRDNDASKGIRSGQLKLAGYAHLSIAIARTDWTQDLCRSDVARFFAPSLQCVLEASVGNERQCKEACFGKFMRVRIPSSSSDISVVRLSRWRLLWKRLLV
jgi:hypothetical protein